MTDKVRIHFLIDYVSSDYLINTDFTMFELQMITRVTNTYQAKRRATWEVQ